MAVDITRRSFIGATAAVGAAVGLVGSADVAIAREGMSSTSADTKNPEAGGAFDMVVAGSGIAGLATALRAKELGIGRVLVLEKRATFGGTAYVAGGCFAAESVLQKKAGIAVTKDQVFRKCMAYHNWANNARVLRRYVNDSSDMIDWLLDEGVEFDDVESTGLSEQTWHIPVNRMRGLMDTLYARAEEEGVTFAFETSAKQLLMRDGKVAGVVATDDGGRAVQYDAPVVVLCTGGYANNDEMFSAYTGWDPSRWRALGFEGRDGDGIAMGLSANAALHIPGAVMVCGYTVSDYDSFSDPIAIAAAWQPSVWVNENGVRFADESITGNFSAAGAASMTVNDVYSVFDKGYLDMLVNEGLVVGPNNIHAAGTKLEGLFEQIDDAATAGDENVFVADSVDELAEKMGLDPEVLCSTIEEYNAYEDGGDTVFGKDASYCRALTTSPYYAFKMNRTFFTTVGGLKIDEQCRVIDTEGKPIPGLYAGGSDTGGLYGYQYDVLVAAGSQCGWGLVGGRFIAQSALTYLGQDA